ncbi:hypothetical protein LTR04_000023 [Oleoguttula sp. CCFEE 6159]|nr:hypothetical protein LTR04_000023 [Oleoguttula sp. CCFEE 6159]
MAGTRSSTRHAAGGSSPPKSSPAKTPTKAGSKRKADSPTSAKSGAKRGKKGAQKVQKSIEETMGATHDGSNDAKDDDVPKDIEMKDAAHEGEGTDKKAGAQENPDTNGKDAWSSSPSCWYWADSQSYAKDSRSRKEGATEKSDGDQHGKVTEAYHEARRGGDKNGEEPFKAKHHKKDDEAEEKGNGEEQEENADEALKKARGGGETQGSEKTEQDNSTGGAAVEESAERAEAMPSSILEKGIIYFFTRGRVGVDEPESVQDLQRSYFVLRPIPIGSKLGDGAMEESKNNRLCALPKKVLPKSGHDKFMVFVDKANCSIQDLKDNFMQGSEYSTKTTGVRHTPPVTPVGEGVYAITTTGRESHLAYMLTIPSELGEVQEEMGIRAKGSFVISLKNPTVSGPANASLSKGPGYPQEIIDEFRGRGWMGVEPKHLNYENAQMLLIGENFDDGNALEQSSKDKKHHKDTPREEIEKLEHEDELRVKHLAGDDSVFEDLGISHKDFPKVMTTW